MATTQGAAAAPSIPAAAQPTIDFITAQINASLPSQYAAAITAQFAGGGSAAPVAAAPAPVQLPAMSYSAAATGTALAAPTISFIEQQINALLPSQYASAITAQFAGASNTASMGAPPTQIPAGAVAQAQTISTDLKNFFAGMPTASM